MSSDTDISDIDGEDYTSTATQTDVTEINSFEIYKQTLITLVECTTPEFFIGEHICWWWPASFCWKACTNSSYRTKIERQSNADSINPE